MALAEAKFLKYVQLQIANTTVGPSTVRGMGPRGTVVAARKHLAEINLSRFVGDSQRAFARRLDRGTYGLLKSMPRGAQHWGTARKLLNIFLRSAAYNKFLCETYDLGSVEPWLEVPLDSHVAKALRGEPGGSALPRWKTVIGLDREVSQQYQDFAATVARRKRVDRVHLDLLYWRQPVRTG